VVARLPVLRGIDECEVVVIRWAPGRRLFRVETIRDGNYVDERRVLGGHVTLADDLCGSAPPSAPERWSRSNLDGTDASNTRAGRGDHDLTGSRTAMVDG